MLKSSMQIEKPLIRYVTPIARPRCKCGTDTALTRVSPHPEFGAGYEIRTFECIRCGREMTAETNPDNIAVGSNDAAQGTASMWSRLRRILAQSRLHISVDRYFFPKPEAVRRHMLQHQKAEIFVTKMAARPNKLHGCTIWISLSQHSRFQSVRAPNASTDAVRGATVASVSYGKVLMRS